MQPSQVKAPGDPGAAARVFESEQQLAEHTECPIATGDVCDGTACVGPDCGYWNAFALYEQVGPATVRLVGTRVRCAYGKNPPHNLPERPGRIIGTVRPKQEGARR